jgi:ubiquinone/menaquinone biosynthesis C-methylase UbiE
MSKKEIINLYRKRAENYDFTANLYYLLGFREFAYRKKTIETLNLKTGDTVVEIGCGTGLNFSLLQKKIGPKGKIIGVDMTDAMLDQARSKIKKKKWKNVILVRGDAAAFKFPKNINAVISTFALGFIPGYKKVIKNAYGSLKKGSRISVLDLKMPPKWPKPLLNAVVYLVKPFIGEKIQEYAKVQPWLLIKKHFKKYLFKEYYMKMIYIAVGEK